MRFSMFAACAGLAIASTSAIAQDQLLAINSTDKIVMAFDPFDGTLLNTGFISGASTPTGWRTPKGIAHVGDEIWVSDQLEDGIYRFDLLGNFIAMVAHPTGAGGLDNIRGLRYIDGVVYQTNAGTQNGAPGNAIVKFDVTGNNLGSFPTISSPFDIIKHNDRFLVTDITSHNIEAYDFNGTYLGPFHSGAIRFPQQISQKADGNFLVAGFSNPSGLYEYDQQGQQVNFIPAAGIRGVHELGNGNIMFSNSQGIHIYDISTQFASQITSGSSQYFALVSAGGDPPCYANCDASTTEPILNVDDFTCFINEFAGAQALPHEQQVNHYANCDQSTVAPVLNVDDFTCFINEFAQGCP